ncbi:MAG: flagellar hook assembly protein FlgD [Stagnimonas sp.]|nr:flagellar hook assembly protein FlgD [Stagnimonas sp.]
MTTAINNYDALGLSQPVPAATQQSLGQEDFLKLMTKQMQSQDPFKPMDSAQFLGQIAQFSTVSGIQSLNSGFASLNDSLTANQALQGASLVGRTVQVPGDTLALGTSGSVAATTMLPSSGTLTATVRNAAGAIVREIDLGSQAAGSVDVRWDGNTDAGERAAAGNYTVTAQLTAADGKQQALTTEIVTPVTAVLLGAQGLQLQVEGGRTVALSAVSSIR